MNLTPRNRLIIQQRAAGRTVQSIAAEHGLSPARVSVICRDHALSIRVAELEAEVARVTEWNAHLLRVMGEAGVAGWTVGHDSLEVHRA
jgi:hypothetical protein